MNDQLYFRPGVGTVIYNDQNQILIFRRKDLPDVWQLQQGGMDLNETVRDTLWRELAEETGLSRDDMDNITEFPFWTVYAYPSLTTREIKDSLCLGQVHSWFFLKIKTDTVIDLAKATDEEFTDYRWADFTELLTLNNEIKLAVYRQLADFFATEIVQGN